MKEFYIHPNCVALKNSPLDYSICNEYDFACLLINEARGCSIDVATIKDKLPQGVGTVNNFINFIKGSQLLEQQKEFFDYNNTVLANLEIGSFLEDYCQDESYLNLLIVGLENDNIDIIKTLVEARADYLKSKIT